MLRFAPSPTGDMCISNLRVAVLSYIIAKQQNKPFLVRIADIDKEHNIEGKDTEIMQILEKFAIQHDLLYHQSEHLNIYQTLAIRLLQEDKAFICKCSPKTSKSTCNGDCENLTQKEYQAIKEKKEPFIIRLKKPTTKGDSFIIIKTDNKPTDNFATACDDMLSNIDTVLCEEKELNNTQEQIDIKTMLGYEDETKYIYLPILLNGDITIQSLFEEGFLPDAILNYIILLESTKTPKEIFTLPESIEWFDIDTISKTSPTFDIETLRDINREHLQIIDDKMLSRFFGFADADIGRLAKVYLKECSTLKELEAKISLIFSPKNFKSEWSDQMRTIEQLILNGPVFDDYNALTEYISKESGLKGDQLFKPLRLLLTGTQKGPKLNDIYPHIKSYLLEVAS